MAFSLERKTMYYIKLFFLYSLLGFVMESTLYKIVSSSRHSSIFYGPVTTVYGFGIIAIELLNKYLFIKIKHCISREKSRDEKINHGVCGVGWKYGGYDF